jgi:restriction system-associated AAA family ATPase
MKLHRIKLLDGEALGILQGFEHTFAPVGDDAIEPLCFIGQNGSGKSRLLRCLAEIFYWVDSRTRLFRPEAGNPIGFRFELEYEIRVGTKGRYIRIKNTADQKRPDVSEVIDEVEKAIKGEKAIRAVLPQFIVGYTSGENETLSVPFLDVRQDYAAELRERALFRKREREDIPDLRLVMMDYHSNFAVVAANFLLQPPERLAFFKEFIRITDIESFRLIIQLNHSAAKRKIKVKIEQDDGTVVEEVREGVQLVPQLEEYLQDLQRCALCYDYDPAEKRWTLDFLVNDETRAAFRHYFGTAYELCMAFQRLSMLNDLMVPNKHRERINKLRRSQKIVIRPPVPAEEDKVFRFESVRLRLRDSTEALDYISISDGEHQFAHIFGTLLIFDHPNVLLLLDEPESHFNPQWRIRFVPQVNAIARGKHQCLLLTSHAPFVISDTRADNVYIFKRSDDGKRIEAVSPTTQTYGASFDRLLEDVFGVKPPISRKSLTDLNDLKKSTDPAQIEARLDEFGESVEKFELFERIEQLKKKS